jgi:hypothetical protein
MRSGAEIITSTTTTILVEDRQCTREPEEKVSEEVPRLWNRTVPPAERSNGFLLVRLGKGLGKSLYYRGHGIA